MSNKSEIHIICEAIIANCRVLEAMVAKLPDATREAVAQEVAKVTPVPAAVQAPAPTQAASVAQVSVTPTNHAQSVPMVDVTPVVAPSNGMPPLPFPDVPAAPAPTPAAPAPVPQTASAGPAASTGALPPRPFGNAQELAKWAMAHYLDLNKRDNTQRGRQMETVMKDMGFHAITQMTPDRYDEFYTRCMAL